MKILGLISSRTDPASRFRIKQYEIPFRQKGHRLHCHIPWPPKESDPPRLLLKSTPLWNFARQTGRMNILLRQYRYDIIWQNRLLMYGRNSVENYYRKPLVFDFDDAIWLTEGKQQVEKVIRQSAMVFAGNEYLCEYASPFHQQVRLVPTVVDTGYFKPLPVSPGPFTLGWIGSASNLPYLEMIREPVLTFLRQTAGSRLLIISSDMPAGFPFDNERIIFRKWRADKENEWLNEFSVGLMPLPDSEWTKGKCGFKLLQYLACGKPVIASPVGVNNQILSRSQAGIGAITSAEWKQALGDLYGDKARYREMAGKGRPMVEAHYSVEKWSSRVLDYFQSLF